METFEFAAPLGLTLVSTIKNGMEAIKLWYDIGDKLEARRKLSHESLIETQDLNETAIEAENLIRFIPEDILRSFQERTERCWERYKKVLDSPEYLPDEIDEATKAVISCVCRELNRLYEVNKRIPDGVLKDYWDNYSCQSRQTL